MNKRMISHLIAGASVAATSSLFGGTETWFTPLTESATVMSPNSTEELTAPWVSPDNISQVNIVSLRQVEDAVLGAGESLVRVPGLGTGASMFDMIAYDPSGSYLFIPHETSVGAGVTRHDIHNRKSEVLFEGDGTGVWTNDYGAFDPCRFTPNGTLWLAEEWAGEGRVIEVTNPFVDLENGGVTNIQEVDTIANVSHEGIMFSKQYDDVVYYVDEDNSGCIYKFVMTTAGDYTAGQTFVLSVDAFAGDASLTWNNAANSGQARTGAATWVALTDASGTPLTSTDPFLNAGSARNGRVAADEIDGTPYGRPEDTEVGALANGNEVLYFTATSEAAVYSVEITSGTTATVRVFCSDSSTPKNLGFAGTTASLNSPDNLAQDALGNIYVIEDAPNSSSTGGDIWFIRDTDGDGVAESIDHFLSIRADGCEATGMIFNPVNPTEFVISVQHPDSTDLTSVTDGLGDAVWMFDLSGIDNTNFVNFLDYATKYPAKANYFAERFNLIN